MSAASYFFYSLHKTLLNFMESTTQNSIVSDSDVVVYSSISYFDENAGGKQKKKRALKIAYNHNCINHVINQLEKYVLQ